LTKEVPVGFDEWFLRADQRGNSRSSIDKGRGGAAWTTGNRVEVLVDGDAYYQRL
jgi:hypothetical protein